MGLWRFRLFNYLLTYFDTGSLEISYVDQVDLELSVSVTQVLGLKVYATMSRLWNRSVLFGLVWFHFKAILCIWVFYLHVYLCTTIISRWRNLALKTLFYIWVFCLHVYLCPTCIPGAFRAQKRASNPWELELQVVWTTMWIQGFNSDQIANALNHWAISSVLWFLFPKVRKGFIDDIK